MSRPSLEEIRRLAEVATKGPWDAELDMFDGDRGIEAGVSSRYADYFLFTAEIEKLAHRGSYDAARESQEMRDARYIAAVDPQTVLALLDELEALRGVEDEARRFVDRLALYEETQQTERIRDAIKRLDKLREGR